MWDMQKNYEIRPELRFSFTLSLHAAKLTCNIFKEIIYNHLSNLQVNETFNSSRNLFVTCMVKQAGKRKTRTFHKHRIWMMFAIVNIVSIADSIVFS